MRKGAQSAFQGDVEKARLATLIDGVFAVALTILVLELKLPEIRKGGSAGELWASLWNHRSTFFSYLLSFLILSFFWVDHNRIYAKLRRISSTTLVIHILLLMTAAFFPFSVHVYGHYSTNVLGSLIYFGVIILFYLEMLALALAAQKQKLYDPDIPSADIRKLCRKYLATAVVLAVCYVLIYIFPG